MNHGDVLVIGGTGDARVICQQLNAAGMHYTLSAVTSTGERLVGDTRGRVRCGRMEWQQMVEWFRAQCIRWVIDASHPYAEVVSQNIVRACASVGVLLGRYQRPEQLSDLRHPPLHAVGDLNEACALARYLGERILLIIGSEDLAAWRAGPTERTLLARVLPVPEVAQHCSDSGLGVGEIFALCGSFSAESNTAFYRQRRADIVVTKASGAEGGHQERVQPCLDAGIPCIVITRPAPLVKGDELLENQADFATRLTRRLSAT